MKYFIANDIRKLEKLGVNNMEREQLLNEMANLLDVNIDELHDGFNIKNYGFDSLIIVSLVAAIDVFYGVRISAYDIEKCITLNDVFNLIQLKKIAS